MATLNSITLARDMTATSVNRHIWIGSVTSAAPPTGVSKGDLIWFDREAMMVLDAGQNPVIVRRGMAGTIAAGHVSGTTGYAGGPEKFSSVDPVGIPPAFPAANPWINTRDGRVWVAQGDERGPGVAARYWQLQTTTRGAVGAFGTPGAVTVTP